jgi:hypothetical protein
VQEDGKSDTGHAILSSGFEAWIGVFKGGKVLGGSATVWSFECRVHGGSREMGNLLGKCWEADIVAFNI